MQRTYHVRILVIIALCGFLSNGWANSKNVDGQPTFKRFNAHLSAIAPFAGIANGAVDVSISPAFSVGPEFVLGGGSAFGVNANYAFNGDLFKSGWMLNPGIYYMHANKKSGVGAKMAVLYQWMWQSGFNLQLGFGAFYNSATGKPRDDFIGNDKLSGFIKFDVGYAF